MTSPFFFSGTYKYGKLNNKTEPLIFKVSKDILLSAGFKELFFFLKNTCFLRFHTTLEEETKVFRDTTYC